MIRVLPEVELRKRSQQLKTVWPNGLCGGLSLQLLFVDYPFTAAIKYLVMKVMEQIYGFNGASMERMGPCIIGVIGHYLGQYASFTRSEISVPTQEQ